MNTYLRILRYSPNLASKLIQFFIYATLGIVFSVVNLALVIPMLKVLFDKDGIGEVPVYPDFEFSIDYLTGFFRYHFVSVIVEYGPMRALLFVCGAIVLSIFFANIFRYMERMIASRIKVDVVKNLRMNIFNNV